MSSIQSKTSNMLCVLVAGMHRSGTSAITRVINLLGADISGDLVPAIPDQNDRGFWESTAIIRIHSLLLNQLNSSWDDCLPLLDEWWQSAAAVRAKSEILEQLQRHFLGSHLFVIKDPRITRLLPLWVDVLKEINASTIIVIPFRNPLEVSASLEKRDQFPRGKSFLLYLRSNLEVELDSRDIPRLFVHYDKFLSDWRPFAARLKGMALSRFAPPTDQQISEVESFLSADLRRNRFDRTCLANAPDIPSIVVEMYDQMNTAAEFGEGPEFRTRFDEFRAKLAEATRIYQDIVLSDRKAIAERDQKLIRTEVAADMRVAAARRKTAQFQKEIEALKK
jgi:hypothetical protein